MKLVLEVNERHRKPRRHRAINVFRVVLIVLALHALVLGGFFIFEAVFIFDPMPGVSAADGNIIRSRLHEVSPPPPVSVRLHHALQVLEADVSSAQNPPVVVTMLAIGPGGILVGTQSHGIHIYNRQTRTWQTASEDDSSAASTNTPPEDASGGQESEDSIIVPPRAYPPQLVARASCPLDGSTTGKRPATGGLRP